ncbi:hypothetical protein GJ496_000456 [Pomphorhynchus laevis]|nr:hypothetical protein GJ496_000456 [Pomphorhynchus laevis]
MSFRNGSVDVSKLVLSAMVTNMSIIERSKPEVFELIRAVFQISKEEHLLAMRVARESVLDGNSKWSAKLEITVVCAQGLIAKDKTGASDPYVTVQVGKIRKRTKTVYTELNPTWNEKFHFECNDSADRIKIRVWDEDDDIRSRMMQRLTRESDDFLGQTLIDVTKLSGDTDLWYNLEKRTDRSSVSGAIRLRISIEIKGVGKRAPYHTQYTCLHENLFNHVYNLDPSTILKMNGQQSTWTQFFKLPYQEIVDEFALRYGIEAIYQAMTHFSCLSTVYYEKGIASIMSNLLANINAYFAHVRNSHDVLSASSRFSACNFKKEVFIKLLDRLHNSIRIDLFSYRTTFPVDKPERLQDLSAFIDLLTSITFFRLKVQDVANAKKTSSIVKDCIIVCIKQTYNYIFANCNDLSTLTCLNSAERTSESSKLSNIAKTKDATFSKEHAQAESHNVQCDQDELTANDITLWSKLITLLQTIIEENQKVYSIYINQ